MIFSTLVYDKSDDFFTYIHGRDVTHLYDSMWSV